MPSLVTLCLCLEQLLLLPACCYFALLADAESDSAFRTIPLCSSRWDIRQADAFEMEPFLLTIIVLTSNHGTKANPVAEAVSRLLRINDIALVINLIKNFLNGTPFTPIFLLFLGTGLLASGCFPFADTDRGGTFGTSSDNSWCWAFGALTGLTRFSRSWCIASCTGTTRSINGRRSCQRRWLNARCFTSGRGWSFQRKWFWNVSRVSRYTG